MKRKRNIRNIVFRISVIMMIVLTVGYLLLGEALLPSESQLGDFRVTDFSKDWLIRVGDGEGRVDELPTRVYNYKQGITVLEKQLPDHGVGGQYLGFWNRGNDLRIYVDGELRQEYDTSDSRILGFVSPYLYVFVPLTEEDAGKTIHLEMELRNEQVEEMLLGDRLDLIVVCGQPYFAEIIFAFLLLMLSLLFLIVVAMLRLWKIRIPSLVYFSVGTTLAAIWIMTNSAIRQFMFPNVSVVRDIAFFAFALFPLFFVMAIDEVQKRRYHKVLCGMEIALCTSFWIMILPYLFHILDFDWTQYFVLVSEIVAIVYIFFTIVMDLKNGEIKQYRIMAIGMAALAIAGMVQLLNFWFGDGFYTAVPMAIGLSFALLCAATSAVMDLVQISVEKDEAITANKAKGDFLANMSHEIRTPINAVLGMDEMILRESTEPEIQSYAQNIHSAGTSLLSLINDILDFSKIESGKMNIVPVNYELSDILADLVVLLEMKAQAKRLKLVWDIDPHIVNNLYGDDVRIKQVLVNILTNAIKYTEKGEVALHVKGHRLGGNQIQLDFAVQDTGIGIKPEDIGRLSNAFQRVDEGRNRHVEGTGLGLSITGQLLQLMGSELKVESTYGEGSTFSFTLLQEIMGFEEIGKFDEEVIHRAAKEEKYKESFVAPNLRILAVDDTEVNLKIFVALLKKTQVQIDVARSGEEALEITTEKHYDLIFLDHMMPGMNGIETLQAMRKVKNSPNKDTKVVALTANAISGAREQYKEAGFDDVLFKPVEGKVLEEMIRVQCHIDENI